ncbi:hypothetical protein [Prauserella muralis]|uniref:Uncharacterized protein n=1 Tax=Prauserella muralis TaxID=588067 RepID=A0A2V4B107_9PSEU|nr:hypothetical protein [Prauserella muralis]PXY27836.1 hypothetical protein BAY60_15820 [Prauserella muralis]TWE22400.1 hypothetical protein FHX69_3639 [Prauserella muralis]
MIPILSCVVACVAIGFALAPVVARPSPAVGGVLAGTAVALGGVLVVGYGTVVLLALSVMAGQDETAALVAGTLGAGAVVALAVVTGRRVRHRLAGRDAAGAARR